MIRPATAADVEAIVAVFEPSFATLAFLPVLHTHEEHLEFFGRAVAESETYVHDRDGVDGFAIVDGDVLGHLYVHPDAFGAGVGSALLDEAKRRRPGGFELWVFQQNERARRFYERRGCVLVRLTDGAGNEEQTPDALYEWRPPSCDHPSVRVSAKADYAIRAMVELAAAGEGPVKAERIAQAQAIPLKFLENIMADLRQAALVRSQRGAEGGYWLARPADAITLAQVIRAVEGPLANVRGLRSEEVEYSGSAAPLREVWIAVRASLRAVLESVTLADVAGGELPDAVAALTADADAWLPH